MELATLNFIREFTKKIEREEQHLQELRACATETTTLLNGMPHSQGFVRDRLGEIVSGIIDLQNLISELYLIRSRCRYELLELLFSATDLKEIERKVLINKFVKLKPMPQTLDELEISERTYFMAQANAFEKLNVSR